MIRDAQRIEHMLGFVPQFKSLESQLDELQRDVKKVFAHRGGIMRPYAGI